MALDVCAQFVINLSLYFRYFTYHAWYPSKLILPDAAGKGDFNYQQKIVGAPSSPLRRKNSLLQNKTKENHFMGMPIYTGNQAGRPQQSDLNVENTIPATPGKYDFQAPPPKFL